MRIPTDFLRRVFNVHKRPSKRYLDGLLSYGKKVRTDKRKARIIAELNAMGVKPRIRVKMRKRTIGFKAYRASMQDPKRSQTTRHLWRVA